MVASEAPIDAFYSAQTQRNIYNFTVSDLTQTESYIRPLLRI